MIFIWLWLQIEVTICKEIIYFHAIRKAKKSLKAI